MSVREEIDKSLAHVSSRNNSNPGLASEVAELLGWPKSSQPVLKVMAGGATGRTFRLHDDSNPDVTPVIARQLRIPEDDSLVSITEILSRGEKPVVLPVLAHSPTWLVQEFVEGSTVTARQLTEAGDCAARIAKTVAILHTMEPAAGIFPDGLDHLGYLIGRVQKLFSSDPPGIELLADERSRALEKNAAGPEGRRTGQLRISHGDLHAGNILDGPSGTFLVDLEFVGIRPVGWDLAYLFAIWGDMAWFDGWKPTDERPLPYPSLAARRAFATAYLNQAEGRPADSSVEVTAVDEFLFDIERSACAKRAHVMCLWLLFSGGDPNHMMAKGVTSTAVYFAPARAALAKALAGESDIKQQIVEEGLLVIGARGANIAANPSCK